MFGTIHNRFNWRRGGTKMIVAAVICAAGLTVGAGDGTLLAQLSGGNPQSNTEMLPYECCGSVAGCSYSCRWSVTLKTWVTLTALPSLACAPAGSFLDQCAMGPGTVACGTWIAYYDSDCSLGSNYSGTYTTLGCSDTCVATA